jgi:hypothetical protein
MRENFQGGILDFKQGVCMEGIEWLLVARLDQGPGL